MFVYKQFVYNIAFVLFSSLSDERVISVMLCNDFICGEADVAHL